MLQHAATRCNKRVPKRCQTCSLICRSLSGFLKSLFIWSTLQHAAPRCTTLQHAYHERAREGRDCVHRERHCNTLQHTATHCNTLHNAFQGHAREDGVCICREKHCNELQHAATRCNTLQHAATRCNTLQHAATRCSTLQHAATRCNTLQQHTCDGIGIDAQHSDRAILARNDNPQKIIVDVRGCDTSQLSSHLPPNLERFQTGRGFVGQIRPHLYECCSLLQCVAVCCSVL